MCVCVCEMFRTDITMTVQQVPPDSIKHKGWS